MRWKTKNFKDKLLMLLYVLSIEVALGGLLGTLPILIYCNSKQSLDEMVSGLLAIGQLIDYYGWLLAPYASLLILKLVMRFRSDRSKKTFDFVYRVINEAGTGFQTILRTGAGVAFGILLLPTEITTPTPANYVMLYGMTTLPIIVSGALSIYIDAVKKRTERQPYNNPLKLNIK